MREPQVLQPDKPCHSVWHLVGLAVLAANKVRYALRSYHHARPFSPRDVRAAAEYDREVWGNWMEYLRDYLGRPYDLAGKTVLELGPGPDLGIGALAMAAGAGGYVAFDRFGLVQSMSRATHERLVEEVLAGAGVGSAEAERVRRYVADALVGWAGPLRYVCREDFDLVAAGLPKADLIVSQAAFEHFDDPQRTIAQLSELAKPGTVFLAVVDLQTHTGLLRRRDPLNIYRYSPRLYRWLSFPGAPNRVRPGEYACWLSEAGWANVQIRPSAVLEESYVRAVAPHLAAAFRGADAQMGCLTAVVCATRA